MGKRFILALSAALFSFVSPAPALEVAIHAGPEYFIWSEHRSGEKLLEEAGQRLAAGIELHSTSTPFPYDFQARVYGGRVHYDGQTWEGDPVETEVDYHGMNAEAGISKFNPMGDGGEVGVRLAVGVDSWRRDLTGPGGYEERYHIYYGRLGIPLALNNGWNGEIGVKYPLSSRETVALGGVAVADTDGSLWTIQEDPVLRPKGKASFYATLGLFKAGGWDLKFRYDSFRFAESGVASASIASTDPATGSPIFDEMKVRQPESRQDLYGLQLRYRF